MTNLRNDHGFISKENISLGMRPFGDTKSKATRAYAQSGQYHTIVEVRGSYQGKPVFGCMSLNPFKVLEVDATKRVDANFLWHPYKIIPMN